MSLNNYRYRCKIDKIDFFKVFSECELPPSVISMVMDLVISKYLSRAEFISFTQELFFYQKGPGAVNKNQLQFLLSADFGPCGEEVSHRLKGIAFRICQIIGIYSISVFYLHLCFFNKLRLF